MTVKVKFFQHCRLFREEKAKKENYKKRFKEVGHSKEKEESKDSSDIVNNGI